MSWDNMSDEPKFDPRNSIDRLIANKLDDVWKTSHKNWSRQDQDKFKKLASQARVTEGTCTLTAHRIYQKAGIFTRPDWIEFLILESMFGIQNLRNKPWWPRFVDRYRGAALPNSGGVVPPNAREILAREAQADLANGLGWGESVESRDVYPCWIPASPRKAGSSARSSAPMVGPSERTDAWEMDVSQDHSYPGTGRVGGETFRGVSRDDVGGDNPVPAQQTNRSGWDGVSAMSDATVFGKQSTPDVWKQQGSQAPADNAWGRVAWPAAGTAGGLAETVRRLEADAAEKARRIRQLDEANSQQAVQIQLLEQRLQRLAGFVGGPGWV